jgi:hypothetical protein
MRWGLNAPPQAFVREIRIGAPDDRRSPVEAFSIIRATGVAGILRLRLRMTDAFWSEFEYCVGVSGWQDTAIAPQRIPKAERREQYDATVHNETFG